MHKKFLVSYDLVSRKDYPTLWSALIRLRAFRVLNSQWVVGGNYTCRRLREYLQQFIDVDDRVLIVDLSAGWSSYNALLNINDVAA